MRIMWDTLLMQSANKAPTVEEFKNIEFTPVWAEGKSTEEDPDGVEVSLDYEYVGEYNLDEISYEEALKNYNYIACCLLEEGYCRASNFKHFTWF